MIVKHAEGRGTGPRSHVPTGCALSIARSDHWSGQAHVGAYLSSGRLVLGPWAVHTKHQGPRTKKSPNPPPQPLERFHDLPPGVLVAAVCPDRVVGAANFFFRRK